MALSSESAGWLLSFSSVLNGNSLSILMGTGGRVCVLPPPFTFFFVQMSLVTVAEMLDCNWTAGLNCKVHWV